MAWWKSIFGTKPEPVSAPELPAISDIDDDLYPLAVALVISEDRASTSLIQRTLKIGYSRAAKFVEAMEADSIVGPLGGDGNRKVFTALERTTAKANKAVERLSRDGEDDFLFLASEAGTKAVEAVHSGDLDKAWGFFHDQKAFYMQHANRCRWSPCDTFALDATVSESLANILRLEGRHSEALVHIIYWISAQTHRPLKRHPEKLKAYFNRCNLHSTTLSEIEEYSASIPSPPDFRMIQLKVREVIDKG